MKPHLAIVLVATGEPYREFARKLIPQIRERFTVHPKSIFLVTDGASAEQLPDGVDGVLPVIHLPMPLPSLLRYHWIDQLSERLTPFTHLYYLDVDIALEQSIGDEILAPLVAVRHWAWPTREWTHEATFEWRPESNAAVDHSHATIYVQASVQGGERERYLAVVRELRDRINGDLNRGVGRGGIIPLWWDESYWNWWVNRFPEQVRILPPEYAQGDPKWSQSPGVLRPPVISLITKG